MRRPYSRSTCAFAFGRAVSAGPTSPPGGEAAAPRHAALPLVHRVTEPQRRRSPGDRAHHASSPAPVPTFVARPAVIHGAMGRYFHSEVDIKSPWHQVLAAFWQRYPGPYSSHVLTEDVLYREVTPGDRLLSRRLLTKTNRLPGWAERVFPAHMARAVYVLEDSVVDPHARTLTTKTWNLNHNTLMTVVERCLFEEDGARPSRTRLRREAWISSAVFGLSRPIQEFGLARFRSNQAEALRGLEAALARLQAESHAHAHAASPRRPL